MLQLILKYAISAALIVAASEISKRHALIGAIIVSLPIVSILAMSWLYMETRSVEKVSSFSYGIFWMVMPSLSLFLILPALLANKIAFPLAMAVSCTVMVILYATMVFILRKLGVAW